MAEETDRPEELEPEDLKKASAAARLFDVRRVIGGLFVVYGTIITVRGIFDSGADVTKAQGVRINLWMGLAMLALGGFFLLWLRWRPAEVRAPADAGDETGPSTPAGA